MLHVRRLHSSLLHVRGCHVNSGHVCHVRASIPHIIRLSVYCPHVTKRTTANETGTVRHTLASNITICKNVVLPLHMRTYKWIADVSLEMHMLGAAERETLDVTTSYGIGETVLIIGCDVSTHQYTLHTISMRHASNK